MEDNSPNDLKISNESYIQLLTVCVQIKKAAGTFWYEQRGTYQ
jgi:hypothetical protein